MADMVGVAHLVLRVDDWKRAARWYQDVLGFERRTGENFTSLRHPGADFLLLFRPTGESIEPTSSSRQRLEHIALHVPTVAALEAWRDRLVGLGIEAVIDEGSVGSSITLHDPDGLEVELFCPAAGSPLSVGRASAVVA